MKDYIEVDVKVNPRQPGSDFLVTELAENGFESFADTDSGFQAWIPKDLFSEESLRIVADLDSELGTAACTWKLIPGQNWNAEWEASYQPVNIGNHLRIRAPFHDSDPNAAIELIIRPQQSFGTGHHPTTMLIAEKLLTMALAERYILDLGCGTGVLAILASRLGAGKVDAVDIESLAVENAIENAQHNSINSITFCQGDTSCLHGKKYDVVIANINKNILMSAIPDFTSSINSGGDLLLSGFFGMDCEALVNAARLDFDLQEIKHNGEWAMIHFRRKN